MPNKHRVLAEGQTLSSNQADISVNKAPTKISRKYMEELEEQNRSLKLENIRLMDRIIETGIELVRKRKQQTTMWVS